MGKASVGSKKSAITPIPFSSVFALSLLLLACLTLPACNRSRRAGSGAEQDSTTFDVTWTDGTVVVDEATVRSQLLRSDPKAGRYVFSAASGQLQAVQPGTVLLLSGTALRRVTSVAKENNEVTIETAPATLNEAIKDGQINWKREILFNQPAARQSRNTGARPASGIREEQLADSLLFNDRAATPKTIRANFSPHENGAAYQSLAPGAITAMLSSELETEYATNFEGNLKGFDVSLKLTPKSERLEIELEVKKMIAGGEGFKITAKGWVSGFTSEGSIRYEQSKLREFLYRQRNLKGEMKIRVTGVRLGSDEVAFAIPLKIPIPIQIGPLPATINIMATLSIVPQLFGESSSRGDFTVSYDAEQGIKLSDGQPTPLGAVTNPQLNISNGNTAGFKPVGLGVTLQFPRVEVSMMGEMIVPYLTVDTRTYGYYSPMVNICQEAGLKITSEVGYKLTFLGSQEWTGSKELWSKETKLKGGNCQ